MRSLLLFVLLIPATVFAQFSDDFTDGEFSSNPAWSGNTSKFVVSAGQELQLYENPQAEGTSFLSTPSEAIYDASWEFLVNMQFNPSSTNYCDVYLVSNNSDLSATTNGYFVRLGNTADEVSLYRKDVSSATMIINGTDGRLNTTAVNVRVKVTRDFDGNWTLQSDTLGGTDYYTEGTTFDNSYISSAFFGVRCVYTSTRSQHFFFDDIVVTGDPFVDDVAPELLSYSVIDNQHFLMVWKNKMSEKRANIFFNDLDPLTMQLRLCKSEHEILTMQNAINITGKTFDKLLKFVKPGVLEFEVEAEMTRNFIAAGANDHAYLPIVASGKNNCILHYNTNRNICKDGDLLLLDFGAEVDYYAADLSRTIPVSGKFTARQKEVYNSVLSVMKEMKKKMIPGTTINNLNSECEQLIQEELLKLKLLTKEDIANQNPEFPAFKKYYMHGVSHFIGLDVHDTGKKDTPLLPGMILSCEPAIYIAEEGFGIRLENDILVADNPVDLCEHIPIEVVDVERLML